MYMSYICLITNVCTQRGNTTVDIDHSRCTRMLPAPPPPLQSVATPSWPGRRLSTRWFVILAPDIPNGCPTFLSDVHQI